MIILVYPSNPIPWRKDWVKCGMSLNIILLQTSQVSSPEFTVIGEEGQWLYDHDETYYIEHIIRKLKYDDMSQAFLRFKNDQNALLFKLTFGGK